MRSFPVDISFYETALNISRFSSNNNRALAWKVHPPTAFCFGKHLLVLLPNSIVKMNDQHAILELARFLTELSVIDYFFVVHKPSVVAFSALLTAMEEIPSVRFAVPTFCVQVMNSIGLDALSEEVMECCGRLRLLYAQGGYANPGGSQDTRGQSISPVCVSYGVKNCRDEHFDPYNKSF